MHVRANPVIGTSRLLRSLSLASQWKRDTGSVVFVTGKLPGILLRQIAISGCDVRHTADQMKIQEFAKHLCKIARESCCRWIVLDDTSSELAKNVSAIRDPEQRIMVLGCVDGADVDFESGLEPDFALVRKNLRNTRPAKMSGRRQPRRCLLDLSSMNGENSAALIKWICRHFESTGIVFDVVTPFAASAAEQLYQQDSPMRDCFFWHRNADRVFQSLPSFHLAVLTDVANFFETAWSGIPGLLLSTRDLPDSMPRSLTTFPWLIEGRKPGWIQQASGAIEQLLSNVSRLSRHASEMKRLIDDQVPLRLCRVIRDGETSSARQVRSA